MSSIEVQITVDLPDGVDFTSIVQQLQSALSNINGKETRVNVIEMDNPISGNAINLPRRN